MPIMRLSLTMLLLYVSCGCVSAQSTSDLCTGRQEALIEHTIDALQTISSRLLSIETRQQSIERRLESIESRELVLNDEIDPAPSNDTPGDFTNEECLSGRLLEEALLVILNKKKGRGDQEQTNEDIAKQETGGEKVEQKTAWLERLFEFIGSPSGGRSSSTEKKAFDAGDRVRVDTDKARAVQLQEGHGGWTNVMENYLGMVGTIKRIAAKIGFSDGQSFWINPALLELSSDENDVIEDKPLHFNSYDVVVVETDQPRAERLQEGHGGWNPRMSAVLGKKGFVRKIDGDGDVNVEFFNDTKWLFNPNLLTIVDTSNTTIQDGDFVFVIDSYEKVKALQDSEHGGWVDDMRETIGKAGIVTQVRTNGRIRVKVGSSSWIYNTLAVTLVAKSGEM